MANTYGFTPGSPGSPDWWLRYLVEQLLNEQSRYDTLEDYHLGNQPPPVADPKHVQALKRFRDMSQANYVTLVNNGPVGRMRVKDFQFGNGSDPDPDARRIWSVNEMDLQSKKLHTAASIFGTSYVLVGPPDPQTSYPTMTVEDPGVAIGCPHPQYPTRSLAGVRMWRDIYIDRVIAVLYLPDAIYTYIGPSLTEVNSSHAEISKRLLGHGLTPAQWVLDGVTENPIGEVPLIKFDWQPDHNGMSLGEAELVLRIQDRINQMIFDRLVTASNQAFEQRYATGLDVSAQSKPDGPKKGTVKAPFELGSANLWVTPKETVKFGSFPAVDFKQMLEAVRDDIADMAAISQTPSHYLMGRMANVSGDTLTQAESGFTSKTKLRMESMGFGWEKAMRVAFKYMGLSKALEPEVTVMWADPMARKDVDAADAASKWGAVGVETGVLMQNLGNFSNDQIAFVREYIAQQKEEAKAEAEAAANITATQNSRNLSKGN